MGILVLQIANGVRILREDQFFGIFEGAMFRVVCQVHELWFLNKLLYDALCSFVPRQIPIQNVCWYTPILGISSQKHMTLDLISGVIFTSFHGKRCTSSTITNCCVCRWYPLLPSSYLETTIGNPPNKDMKGFPQACWSWNSQNAPHFLGSQTPNRIRDPWILGMFSAALRDSWAWLLPFQMA